jgi:phenylacetate 2-hydroxylase
MPFIDFESTRSIKEMISNSKGGTVDLDPSPYFQRYALSTSLTLNYGLKIEGNVDDEMLKEITYVEREISNFRSTSHNWQDYIPLMRIFPSNNTKPLEFKKRRGAYMNQLLSMLKKKIADGTDKPCITGNILKDPEAKLNDGELDVSKICNQELT